MTEDLDVSHEVDPAVVTEREQTAALQDCLVDVGLELGQEEPAAGHTAEPEDAVELSGLDAELAHGIAVVVQEAC